MKRNSTIKRWFLIAYFLYFLSVVVYHLYNYSNWNGQSIFGISYGFGKLIENITTSNTYAACNKEFCFTAHRMPFIPYFLSAIAYFNEDYLFVKLLKNLVFVSLFWLCIYYIWIYAKNVTPYALLLILGFTLSFTPLFFALWSINVEEGYLISFISLLFVHLLLVKKVKNGQILSVQNHPRFLILAIVNSLVFLTKSSTAPLSIVFCLLYYWITRSFKVFVIFACSLFVASLSWGLLNLHNSGVFTTASSWNGWNLYKGNNELTSSIYPSVHLDNLDRKNLIAPEIDLSDEWSYDKYYRNKAIEFMTSHPIETLRLFTTKFYVFFISISEGKALPLPALLSLNTLYRLVFRIIFILCFVYALRSTFFKKGRAMLIAEEKAVISAAYICVVLVYSAPFLAGFAYERHVMPLVLPTMFYLVWMLDKRGQSSAT